ncbi:unnamed protein product [Angiostrongylus costaricensis]|uniref:Four helix bundle protein n=1 Tax=Angiostrongylus costaricensis TaxID=334426 RepID=A0A0R3PI52_ANGCS|nr:unnamed protein product [Angiostrongylus costaricensis]
MKGDVKEFHTEIAHMAAFARRSMLVSFAQKRSPGDLERERLAHQFCSEIAHLAVQLYVHEFRSQNAHVGILRTKGGAHEIRSKIAHIAVLLKQGLFPGLRSEIAHVAV